MMSDYSLQEQVASLAGGSNHGGRLAVIEAEIASLKTKLGVAATTLEAAVAPAPTPAPTPAPV